MTPVSTDEVRSPITDPTDQEGRALAAFASGRWRARISGGNWVTGGVFDAEGRQDPEIIGGAALLHAMDWLDTKGELTDLGRYALNRWPTADERRRQAELVASAQASFDALEESRAQQ